MVLPVQLKTCRSNVFLFFTKQNVRPRKIGRVSEVSRARTQFVQTCLMIFLIWVLYYAYDILESIKICFRGHNLIMEQWPSG